MCRNLLRMGMCSERGGTTEFPISLEKWMSLSEKTFGSLPSSLQCCPPARTSRACTRFHHCSLLNLRTCLLLLQEGPRQVLPTDALLGSWGFERLSALLGVHGSWEAIHTPVSWFQKPWCSHNGKCVSSFWAFQQQKARPVCLGLCGHFIGKDGSCPRPSCSLGTAWKPGAFLVPDSFSVPPSKPLPAEWGDGLCR